MAQHTQTNHNQANTSPNGAPSSALQPAADLLSVEYRGESEAALKELSRLAELVGVSITHLNGADRRAGVLQFSSEGTPDQHVKAKFHTLFAQYFAPGSALLNYQTEAEKILELLVAVGATVRGKVLGVVAAHGGAGATNLAAWIASTLARSGEEVALIDLDPASAGIELLLSIVGVPGKRWPDLHGNGALLPGRLNSSLPEWNGVRVLSADERGGPPLDARRATGAVAALAQLNSWTILDLPRSVLLSEAPSHALLEWCDYLLVVTRASSVQLAATHTILSRSYRPCPMSVVANAVTSLGQAAHISQMLAVPGVFTVRNSSKHVAAVEHGVAPGARVRTSYARDVERICAYISDTVA